MTCETESNNLRIGFASFLLNAAKATPNKIEKITICKISLVAKASNKLFGITCFTNSSNENPFEFSNNSEALDVSSNLIVVPFPGSKKFTKTIPNNKEIKEAEINQAMAFPPTRPTIFMSPILAIPTTKVEKTKGAIII